MVVVVVVALEASLEGKERRADLIIVVWDCVWALDLFLPRISSFPLLVGWLHTYKHIYKHIHKLLIDLCGNRGEQKASRLCVWVLCPPASQ